MSNQANTAGATWDDRDYPVLIAAVKLCQENDYNHTTCDAIVSETGLSKQQVVRAVGNLGQRYLNIKDAHSMASADYIITGPTVEGLVAAEIWPSPDALQERFVAALEAMIENTPVGSPKAKKLEGVLEAVRDLATSSGGSLFGQLMAMSLGN